MVDKYINCITITSELKHLQYAPNINARYSFKVPSVHTSFKLDTSTIFQDWYKKIDTKNTTWNVSVFNTGSSTIGGILTENLKPIPECMLYLYQASSGVLAKQTISKEDGSFLFTGILPDISYFVVGIHKARKFNAVVLDEVRIDSRL